MFRVGDKVERIKRPGWPVEKIEVREFPGLEVGFIGIVTGVSPLGHGISLDDRKYQYSSRNFRLAKEETLSEEIEYV